ncbi:5'-3' exonuclease PLD3-like isoform X2 [Centruroides vittatus]|uniref:5'-3' exonuclease PLD3-like isoform X2 n=1 Tax=Centruroides vittatus TaxID=120091 RepID=UPI0035107AF9
MGIRISSIYRQTVVEGTGKLDVGEFELQLFDSRYMLKKTVENRRWNGWIKPSCIPISIIFILIVLVVLLPLLEHKHDNKDNTVAPVDNCTDTCWATIVESIPENLTYPAGSPQHLSTYEGWMNLIGMAQNTIDIASFYWTLKGNDVIQDPSDWQGEMIFKELLQAGTERKININIAQNIPSKSYSDNDTKELETKGAATVRNLNFTKLLGSGILHTKFWIIDNQHFYIGSANMDWRALTQVKELGIIMYNCSCLAKDLKKIFDAYWLLGKTEKIPLHWPAKFETPFNKYHPALLNINDTFTNVYLSSSPVEFCPKSRTTDLLSILNIIYKAEKFIYISVMDYFPALIYSKHLRYWATIDDALKEAAINRRVNVKLLISHWNHTRPVMLSFLKSLQILNSKEIPIEVKLFVVPSFTPSQSKIPFARVNHNKYMVTEKTGYIGTSNWSEDYFKSTAGVGFIVDNVNSSYASPIQQQLKSIFDRDWFSEYAHSLTDFDDFR